MAQPPGKARGQAGVSRQEAGGVQAEWLEGCSEGLRSLSTTYAMEPFSSSAPGTVLEERSRRVSPAPRETLSQ